MITRCGRFVSLGVATVVLAGLNGGLSGPATLSGAVLADEVTVSDGMPTQEWTDLISTDEAKSSSGQAGWGDLAGGTSSRPYVTALSVTNGSTVTPVVVGGTTGTATPESGQVATTVAPYNLCRVGQTPSPGSCYATPNRVAVTVGYNAGDSNGRDFANPTVAMDPTVDANSIIDMTVALNTLGRNLRWSWVNGDLLYWRTTNLGQSNATVRIRFKPADAPALASFPDGNGCTATPIFNCAIATSDAEMLSASVVFSLDNTLDQALTGAVFATQNAIAGFLQPGGTPTAPTLDVQVASTHTNSLGDPQLGAIKAFIPAAALVNLYGLLPSDAATAFTTTRTGDVGTNAAPTYTPWTSATNGAEGLLVTVRNITFSVPKYKVKGKLAAVATTGVVKGSWTAVSARVPSCTLVLRCAVTVYDLGAANAARYAATRTAVRVNVPVSTASFVVTTPTTTLRKGHRYLLVVRAATSKRLLASALGVVR